MALENPAGLTTSMTVSESDPTDLALGIKYTNVANGSTPIITIIE